MLRITIPAGEEQWDEINQMFIYPKEQNVAVGAFPCLPFKMGIQMVQAFPYQTGKDA